MTIGMGPHGGGVLRMVRPGVMLHWCPACEVGHTFDVHALNADGKVNGWDGDFLRPSLDKPLRHDKEGRVCEYLLKSGVQYYLQSCTHQLAGEQRHLIEYPR